MLATAIVLHADRLAEVIELPEGTHPITMVPVASSDTLEFKRAPRRPVEEILHWERWGR